MQGIQCQIRVKGHLNTEWSSWFDDLAVIHEAHGETVLAGTLTDDAALYGVLMKIRDIGLPLLALQRDIPQKEEEQ